MKKLLPAMTCILMTCLSLTFAADPVRKVANSDIKKGAYFCSEFSMTSVSHQPAEEAEALGSELEKYCENSKPIAITPSLRSDLFHIYCCTKK